MPTDAVVFVVDDDDAVRESLEISLKLAGHQVESFASAPDFLASGAPSRSGCLITDIRMPGMDGLELQEELKKRNSALPTHSTQRFVSQASGPCALDNQPQAALRRESG